MMSEIIPALIEVKRSLELAGIEYMVVGSLASSVHGLPRTTRDADLMVAIDQQQARTLASALRPRFYISEEVTLNAIRDGASFNAIHEDSFFQIDMFVLKPTPFKSTIRAAAADRARPRSGHYHAVSICGGRDFVQAGVVSRRS